MRELAEIEKEIEQTKEELKNVHGSETEVYARIVGYYRAVKHWNKGKRDEFDMRKMFSLKDSNLEEKQMKKENHVENNLSDFSSTNCENELFENSTSQNYELYVRKTCPNCPPVKEYMQNASMNGKIIDVDTEIGLSIAAKNGVFSAPTVIFYDEQNNETARCHNVEELQEVFNKVLISA